MVRRAALLSALAAVAVAVAWSAFPAAGQQASMKGTFVFAEFSKNDVKGLVAVMQRRERRVVRVVGALQGLKRSGEYRLVLSTRSCARERPGPPVLSTGILASPEYFVVGARRNGPLGSVKSARVIEFQDGDDFLLICTRTLFTQDDSLPPPPPDI